MLLTQEEIAARVQELGATLAETYAGRLPLFVCVLKGATVFLSDLMRAMRIPVEIDFMATSSYGLSTDSSGVVRILKDLDHAIIDRDVLIVEDVIDSGLTLHYLYEHLRARHPASLRMVTLLDKPDRRTVSLTPDWCGFHIPDRFVVGYGLDVAEHYRNVPFIFVPTPLAIHRATHTAE